MKLETLRERLKGSYDLESAEDCQKVIRVLLRANDKANESVDKLRELALDVISGKPEAAKKAADVLRGREGSRSPAQVFGFLKDMAERMSKVEDMADWALAEAVLDKVWAGLDISRTESALLGELVERFKRGTKEGRK